jgi:hypothetical protein
MFPWWILDQSDLAILHHVTRLCGWIAMTTVCKQNYEQPISVHVTNWPGIEFTLQICTRWQILLLIIQLHRNTNTMDTLLCPNVWFSSSCQRNHPLHTCYDCDKPLLAILLCVCHVQTCGLANVVVAWEHKSFYEWLFQV